MKKGFKRVLSFILSVLLIFSTVSILTVANAASIDDSISSINFWVDVSSSTALKSGDLGTIKAHNITSNSKNYYLFLPSNTDVNSVKVYYSANSATIDDQVIINGGTTDVFSSIQKGSSSTFTLKLDTNSYTLTVVRSGDVATMHIITASGSLADIHNDKEHNYGESAEMLLIYPDSRVNYCGSLEYIKGRGNATWKLDKRPYNIKLAVSSDLLGLGKAKKWSLIANYNDTSLLKNKIMFDLADAIGLSFTCHMEPIDLYANGKYLGSYMLCERPEIKSNRINITDSYEATEIANGTVDPVTGAILPADLSNSSIKFVNSGGGTVTPRYIFDTLLNPQIYYTEGNRKYAEIAKDPADLTGGYLVEYEISDRWGDENIGGCLTSKQCFVIKSNEFATKNQLNYVYNSLDQVQKAVYNSTDSSWQNYLDADDAALYYWTQELPKNLDSSTTSTYFWKESDLIGDKKWHAGPVWDFDASLNCYGSGSRFNIPLGTTDGWYTRLNIMYKYNTTSSNQNTDYNTNSVPKAFYAQLCKHPDFVELVGDKWYQNLLPKLDTLLSSDIEKTDGNLKTINKYAAQLQYTSFMNNIRWESSDNIFQQANTMKNWLTERSVWITTQFEKYDISKATIEPINNQIYNGKGQTPDVAIKYNSKILQQNLDYTLKYDNNVNASSTAGVIIQGIGRYENENISLFTISPANISNFSLTLPKAVYVDETIKPVLKDENGKEVLGGCTYQWYLDNVAVDGATSESYTITKNDINKKLTVVATGSGNCSGVVTSSESEVAEIQRPEVLSQNIAEFNYNYTENPGGLISDKVNGFTSTGGIDGNNAVLFGCVDANKYEPIKWSGADLYINNGVSDQSPIIGTSKTDSLAWGEYPYFQVKLSTKGYNEITFSSKLGGTKKAPRDFKLQYSLDGVAFTDVENAVYTLTSNKTMLQAFDNVPLPEQTENKDVVYIRMVATSGYNINGDANAVVGVTSGDLAVNNIVVAGKSDAVINTLTPPTSSVESGKTLFTDDKLVLTENNGGATIKYSVNGNTFTYDEPFAPFEIVNSPSATVEMWAEYGIIKSDKVIYEYKNGGDAIGKLSYDASPVNVVCGKVPFNGGVYSSECKIYASSDGNNNFVPKFNDKKSALAISPDDGYLWNENGGWTMKISTAAYENITLSLDACSSGQGPKSMTLSYSFDGINFVEIEKNKPLPFDTMASYYDHFKLPTEIDNRAVVYLRLAITENARADSLDQAPLYMNMSKGNTYIDNVFIAGTRNGSVRMPYSTKVTDMFGLTGTVKYENPDNGIVRYTITDKNNNVVVANNIYTQPLSLGSLPEFRASTNNEFTVTAWAEVEGEKSLQNIRTFKYKGDSVADFSYNKDNFNSYLSYDTTQLYAVNDNGTLSMSPNGVNNSGLSFTNSYGVKVSANADNSWVSNKQINKVDGNGYWLLTFDTLGFKELSINLEQISSSKGPRDFSLAYSLDSINYIFIDNSLVRTQTGNTTVETYNNFRLPSILDNQKQVYLKIFINGGENIDGKELDDPIESLGSGNTGVNNLVVSGTPLTDPFYGAKVDGYVGMFTNATDIAVGKPINQLKVQLYDLSDVLINDTLTDINGYFTFDLVPSGDYYIIISGKASLQRKINFTVDTKNVALSNSENKIGVYLGDFNQDGLINTTDYTQFVSKLGLNQNNAEYSEDFDLDNNGYINASDNMLFTTVLGCAYA